MKVKSKMKGFTLVELLAVIVILAIILAIAVPSVTNLISSSRKSSLESESKLIIKGISNIKLEDPSFDETTLNETNVTSKLGVPSDNIADLSVAIVDGVRTITVQGQGEWAGYYACGTYMDMKVVTTAEECAPPAIPPVNVPVLATGMTPIKWVNGTETTTTANDAAWYDYANKLWANAKTADGSYWVWIPRYAYSITSGFQSSTAGTIEIKFLSGNTNNAIIDGSAVATTPTYSGNSQTNYVLHPAFNFGGTQLTGIWVAKFEATNNSNKVKIVPNITAWRNIDIATMYNNSRAMETNTVYGWDNTGNGIDTHMMKNTEWGAAAYLAKSTFGFNEEIWVNVSYGFITGCAGNSVSAPGDLNCVNAYNTTNGQKASTTGNITGIYDMSGGAMEWVMANYDNVAASSGLTPSSIPDKYIDRYSATDGGYSSAYFGDAYYETSNANGNTNGSWYGDNSGIPTSSFSWIRRGGLYSNGVNTGSFAFSSWTGATNTNHTFRPVLMVGTGL